MDPYAREWRNGNSRWDIVDLRRFQAAAKIEAAFQCADKLAAYSREPSLRKRPALNCRETSRLMAAVDTNASGIASINWRRCGNYPALWLPLGKNPFLAG